jgi:hypothetical protein
MLDLLKDLELRPGSDGHAGPVLEHGAEVLKRADAPLEDVQPTLDLTQMSPCSAGPAGHGQHRDLRYAR